MTDIIERTETVAPEPAYALGALLGVPVPDLEKGEGLPPLWHWVYLLDRPAQADLGPDGHPVRGTLPAPPGPGRRRMWAGGRVRTRGSLRCGLSATKRTSVLSVTEKQGRSGHLTFITVGHQIVQGGELAVDEEQDIVYRDAVAAAPGLPVAAPAPGLPVAAPAPGLPVAAPAPGLPVAAPAPGLPVAAPAPGLPVAAPAPGLPAAAPAPGLPVAAPGSLPAAGPGLEGVVLAGEGEWVIDVSPTLLFRFSALTYNAHRIHYDRDYCRDVEGYPGLLTHGPLQALAMAEAARTRGVSGDVSFEYRLISPLFDYQGLVVSAAPGADGMTATAARDHHGRQTASGTVVATS